MKTIGIFGGTFNPPHLGHLDVIQLASKVVDTLLVIPAQQSPHKANRPIDPIHRIAMLKLLFKSAPNNVNLTLWDLERTERSFFYKTFNRVLTTFPECKVILIIGADQFKVINTWTKYTEWRKQLNYLVMPRITSISSTKIRSANAKERIALTGVEVAKYITNNKLYEI